MENFKLKIDLLPKGAWNNDFSKTLSKKDWDTIREFCYKRANGKCQICGFETADLDAHEVWDFDISNKKQTLKNIIAICSKCHGVIHFKNSARLGFGEQAKQHFINTNKCSEIEFTKHLTKAVDNYNERNKVFRWEMCADLKPFGGENTEIKQKNIPFIKNPYENINWDVYDFLKNNYKSLFLINNKESYYSVPNVLEIKVDNYQGLIKVVSNDVNKIEWFLDEKKIKTKYNVIGKFKTEFSVKNLVGKNLYFKLAGFGGEIVSKNFEIFDWRCYNGNV